MVVKAQELVKSNDLLPSDIDNRLQASAIFPTDNSVFETLVMNLPTSVPQNIDHFKLAVYNGTFYRQPNPSTDHVALALNNIISSTYLLHGTARQRPKGSEINLIATSVSTFLSPFFNAPR